MSGRLHLFEFEDLKYLPRFLRGYITDLLTYQIVKFGVYKAVAPKIAEALKSSGENSIVDLCTGSGGPAMDSAKEVSSILGKNIHIILTDKFPNTKVFKSIKNPYVQPIHQAVDARAVPKELKLKGMRTLFTAFHHFKPDDGQQILQDAVNQGMSIGVFEITERKFKSLMTLLVAPITCLICTLFVRPFKVGRFFWTYIIPLVPILYTWDGLISNLRSYTKSEWLEMTKKIKNDTYSWEVGEVISKFKIKVSYLIGKKKVYE